MNAASSHWPRAISAMKTTHTHISNEERASYYGGCLVPIIGCMALAVIIGLSACSNPMAGPDQFDIGLAQLMQSQGQAAVMREQRLANASATQQVRTKVLKPLQPLKPVKHYAEQPDNTGRFLPLPQESADAGNAMLPPPADLPMKLGGGPQ